MFFALLHQQRLRRQHVLDLARADAERERAERAVRAGVRVAADDRHAGQRRALLRPDHVHDALAPVVHELGDAVATRDVGVERVDLQARDRVGDAVRAGRVVGMLWSLTRRSPTTRQTLRPASSRPSKACGLVTSCTRWRSM